MSSEEKPPEVTWQHDKSLSLSPLRDLLVALKEKTEKALSAQKQELAKMVGARDSLK